MRTIGLLLRNKGGSLWSTAPGATVYDALRVMAEKDVGALLVMEGGKLVGIISERDYARKVVLKGRTSRETLVREIMTERPICIRTDQTIEEAMALMTNKRIRHLPVLAEGRLAGVISIGDVVKDIISEQEFTIHQLENYITGHR